jgi:hypothetical protein
MRMEQRAWCLEAGNSRTSLNEAAHWFQVRPIHFHGNAAVNAFEGENHVKAVLQTHDNAFDRRLRARANAHPLAHDQQWMRLRPAKMQVPSRTQRPAPRGYSEPAPARSA